MRPPPAVEPKSFVAERDPAAAYVLAAKEAFEPGETGDSYGAARADHEETRAWAGLEARLFGTRPGRRWLLVGMSAAAGAGLTAAALALFAPGGDGLGAGAVAHAPSAQQAALPRLAHNQIPEPDLAPPPGLFPPAVDAVDAADIVDAVNEPPPAPSVLRSGRSVLPGGVRARLSPRGRAAVLTAPSSSPSLLLEQGTLEIDAAVASPPAAGHVNVRVAAFRVEGDASSFSVSAQRGDVSVAVHKGEVAVWSKSRLVVRVLAGQRWTNPRGALDRPAPGSGGVAPTSPAAAPAEAPPAEPRDCVALAGRGLTDEAVACLEAQSASPGLPGELAFLELARIRRDVRGDLAGAERALADYRRRFPRGRLAEEAGTARVELLVRLDRPAEALAEAERLAGSEGMFWRAVSLTKLARAAEARRAFDDYLARPDGRRRADALRKRRELGP